MNRLTYILWLALIGLTVAVPKRDRNDYTKNAHRVVCYFNSWAEKREVDPFTVDNIDPTLCTHLNWDFATINENTLEIEMADKQHLLDYQRFNGLHKKYSNLTTLVSLGGWEEGSQKFSDMAKTTKLRQDFVKSIVEFLTKYDFDGLDLDWEFPGVRQGNAKIDRQDLSLLLEEMRTAFDPLGFLLTIAVSPGKQMIDSAYNVPDLNKYADWLNLMTYDYHGGWDKQIGHNSPLYSRPDEVDEHYTQWNVNFSVNYIIEKGAEPKKIVMGMPFYGRGYTLINSTLNKVHDPADGFSPAGFITGQKGIYGYNEICQLTDNNRWVHTRDPYYKAPIAYDDKVWIGYDDVDSIACKSSFIKSKGLSGGMIFALDYDDFKNRCGGGVSPLLHKVHSLLNGDLKAVNQCK